MEKSATQPGARRLPARAHRGTVVKISRAGRESEPHVVPTEKDRKRFDMLRPEEVEQGYSVRWTEPQKEPLPVD